MDGRLRLRMVLSSIAVVASLTAVVAAPFAQAATSGKTYVYWDQSQKVDYSVSDGSHGQLLPSNSHGQMCIFPHSGYFTVGYNGTQRDADGIPATEPPVGIAAYDPHGHFVKSIHVPGPYKSAGQTDGSDIPSSNDGSYVGCTLDKHGNLWATDAGTAHGQVPTPDDGRVIEFFSSDLYSSYCIVSGPTTGGFGAHHVDGTGGLRQPGLITFDAMGNLYVPEAGAQQQSAPAFGRVLRYFAPTLPKSAKDCPGGVYPPRKLISTTFLQGSPALQPFPVAAAFDLTCGCIVVSSVMGEPAVMWYDLNGRPYRKKGPVLGIASNGQQFNPYGIAVDLQGNLFFADRHTTCSTPDPNGFNCNPQSGAGGIYKVTFKSGVPNTPRAIATGLTAPSAVTICIIGHSLCPVPGPRIVTNAEKRAAVMAAHRAAVQRAYAKRAQQRQARYAAYQRRQHEIAQFLARERSQNNGKLARTGASSSLPTSALLAMLLGGAAYGLRRWSGSTAD